MTFDFEGTKITPVIRKEDVEPSKVKKGEIVRAILSKMPWYYNASAVTCERAGSLGGYSQPQQWNVSGYSAGQRHDFEAQLGREVLKGVAVAGLGAVAKIGGAAAVTAAATHPAVRIRIFAGALELVDDVVGSQGWMTQMLRQQALRANSVPEEMIVLPRRAAPIPGLRPPASP